MIDGAHDLMRRALLSDVIGIGLMEGDCADKAAGLGAIRKPDISTRQKWDISIQPLHLGYA